MGSKSRPKVFFGFFFEDRKTAKHAALAVAERWFPKTEAVEKAQGCIVCLESYLGQFRRAECGRRIRVSQSQRTEVVPGIYQCG